jgi:SulP family sulfate permease
MVLVLGLTVFVDLITAVVVGVVMASLAFVKQISDLQLEKLGGVTTEGLSIDLNEEEDKLFKSANKRISLFDFGGPLSFGAAADLGHQVREKSKGFGQALVLDFSRVPFIDVSAARAVETIGCDAEDSGKRVFISGMNQAVKDTLAGLEADCCLPTGVYFDTRLEALQAAKEYIDSSESKPKDGSTLKEGQAAV